MKPRLSLLMLLLLSLGLAAGCSTNDTSEPPSSKSPSVSATNPKLSKPTPESTPIASKESEPSEKPFDWKTEEVNEENVRKALEEGVTSALAIKITDKTFRKVVSSSDTKGEYLEITVNPGDFWDEKDFVKRSGGSLVAYSKVLFENPAVYEVSINVKINNVGGGENNGVYLSWRRDNVKGLNFDTVLDNTLGDYSVPFSLVRKYSIQDDIYEKLKNFDLPSENNL